MKATLAHSLWIATSLQASRSWWRATKNVEASQTDYLLALVQANKNSQFGQVHNFANIRSVADFQASVPFSSYEDYVDLIQQIEAGQPNILSAEPIRLLEPTSGSTSASKLIPYTRRLQNEFTSALGPWIVDLFTHQPELMHGSAYWSISPATYQQQRSSGGIPIGFEDDSAYFGHIQQALVAAIQLAPSKLKQIQDWNTFRYVTLLLLLQTNNLRLISVWNPTFLELLLEPLHDWRKALLCDLETRTITAPQGLAPAIKQQLEMYIQPTNKRLNELKQILDLQDQALRNSLLWPNLRLISCWRDAQAAPYAERLAKLFPQAILQGKGLIATEAIVSFPLTGYQGAALALRSHFFEFLPLDKNTPKLAHELEQGQQYQVVLTTGGGLYRYQLHDCVQVVGFVHQCPLLEFIGKTALVSDHFGEKVHALHLQTCLDQLFHVQQPRFVIVACEHEPHPHYGLFIETSADDLELQIWATALDHALRENIHYNYCREIGQLGPVQAYRIAERGLERWTAACYKLGQRPGDIKPLILQQQTGWRERLNAYLIE